MDARAAAATITRHATEALADTDLDVVVDGVTVQEAGRRRLVRVLLARDLSGLSPDDVTSTVQPLSLDEVSEATRSVAAAVDTCSVMGERPYTLEVGSTGLDRPLTEFAHFRRNVGRLLKVSRADGSTLEGRLLEAGPEHLTIAGHDPLPLADVAKARVQVEFSSPERKDA
ncbi:hypothetical protein BJF86_04045 [Serinicoccus sp. CNJ-927]|nr:hypothetical protein BJF86_04045 [Serinicoccus sp. CNJ-927]